MHTLNSKHLHVVGGNLGLLVNLNLKGAFSSTLQWAGQRDPFLPISQQDRNFLSCFFPSPPKFVHTVKFPFRQYPFPFFLDEEGCSIMAKLRVDDCYRDVVKGASECAQLIFWCIFSRPVNLWYFSVLFSTKLFFPFYNTNVAALRPCNAPAIFEGCPKCNQGSSVLFKGFSYLQHLCASWLLSD